MAHLCCYRTLGVGRDASVVDVRSAYRRAALLCHPDKGGSAEAFRQLVRSFETLVDPELRRLYDEALIKAQCYDGALPSKDTGYQQRGVSHRSSHQPSSAQKGSANKFRETQHHCKRRTSSERLSTPSSSELPAGASATNTVPRETEPIPSKMEASDTSVAREGCSNKFDAALCTEGFLAVCPSRWPAMLSEVLVEQLRAIIANIVQELEKLKKRRARRPSTSSALARVTIRSSNGSSYSDSSTDESEHNTSATTDLIALTDGVIQASRKLENISPVRAMLQDHADGQWLNYCDATDPRLMLPTCDDLADVEDLNAGACPSEDHAHASANGEDRLRLRGICLRRDMGKYYAIVGVMHLLLRSQYVIALDDAISHHIILMDIKTMIKAYCKKHSPAAFNDAARNAMAATSAAVAEAGMKIYMNVQVHCWSKKELLTSQTFDLECALHMRSRLVQARQAGSEPLLKEFQVIQSERREAKLESARRKAEAIAFARQQARASRQAEKRRRIEEVSLERAARQAKRQSVLVRRKLLCQLLEALRVKVKAQDRHARQHKASKTAAARAAAREERTKIKLAQQDAKCLARLLHRYGLSDLPAGIRCDLQERSFFSVARLADGAELAGPLRENLVDAEDDLAKLQTASHRGDAAVRMVLVDLEIAAFARTQAVPWLE